MNRRETEVQGVPPWWRRGSNNTTVERYKAHFSYRILQNGKNIYVQNIKTWKELFLPLLYITWGLCEPVSCPCWHGYKISVSRKTTRLHWSWSSWKNKECKLEQKLWEKPGIHGRDRVTARRYKIIKNSHVNNIIITRVTVICCKKNTRKW